MRKQPEWRYNWLPALSVDPAIRFGRPVIQGTRVPVDLVLTKLAAGMIAGQIADDYDFAPEDIQAVLTYAARSLAEEEVRLAA
jgi:uncharacterized protein (DUF433 family)